MRVRGKTAVILVLAVMAGLVLYGVVRSHWQSTSTPEDFLEEARRLAEQAPGQEGRGTRPPITGDASEVPVIEVEPSGVLDFGVVAHDQKTPGEFKIHNRGKSLLTISQIDSACWACTRPVIEERDKQIPPGGTSVVKVTIDPSHIPGFVSTKTITIMSDDPENPKLELKTLVKVDPEFQVDPPEIDFGEVSKGVSCEKAVIFRQVSEEPFEITSVTEDESRGELNVSFVKRPETEWAVPGKPEYLVTIGLSEEVSPGALVGRVLVASSCKRLPIYRYIVKATVTSFYTKSATSVMLSDGRVQGLLKDGNIVTVTADRPFEISAFTPSLEEVVAVAKPGTTPNSATIEFSLKPDIKPGRRDGSVGFTIKAGDIALKDHIAVRVRASRVIPPVELPGGPEPSPAPSSGDPEAAPPAPAAPAAAAAAAPSS